ncbi:MAG: YmdB family metallophosphoesterase [Planctomycetes bacterium]|nr:YmdB family metallophosphoesterase [Planctomycetota bacterium]
MAFRILALGDIVGSPGRTLLRDILPGYVRDHDVDFVVANGENVAAGSGINLQQMEKLLTYSIDVLTSGDHIWRRMEIAEALKPGGRLLRPENYPADCPGRGLTVVSSRSGVPVAVINVQGRIFMDPIDCPFHAVDRAIEEAKRSAVLILVDFHAEATSEKVAMAWHLDGRVSAVWGTHTHVQTADERILPGGTACITDLGMTGSHRSVLGRKIEPVLQKMVRQLPAPFDVAEEDVRASGVLITVDPATGRAAAIERVQIRQR